MDLSMILNDDGDDGGYASSPAPSPRASHVPASSRWSVDEMRSAVAILSDIQGPNDEQEPRRVHGRAEPRSPVVDDDETEDERDVRFRRRPAPVRPPRTPSPTSSGFSGLDLLFQADAMIQKRMSPERPASRAEKPTKKTKKAAPKPSKKKTAQDDDDVDADEDEDVEGTPKASPAYLRSGFWTRAEEEYAAALIFYFLRGALPIAEGTTLRKYLAEQLCCNRRRVSMKLATETIADKKIPRKVGASVFVALKPAPSDADRDQVRETLDKLRRDCFREVEGANFDNNNDDDMDDMRTPRQTGSRAMKKEPVSPLLLGANQSSPSEKLSLQSTPARRKTSGSKPTPSPKKRRPSVSSNPKSSPPNIRRRRPMIIRTGFDTPEEEEFVTALVEYFTDGLLELNDDTRLVSYLCEQLDCSPKTLSMKLAPRKMGEHKFPENIGTIVYARKDDDDASSEIFEAEAHVFELRQNWLQARDGPQEETEGPAGDDDEAEEKASLSSSPVSTPSRKVKSEPSAVSSTPGTKSPSNAPRSYSRSGPWSRHEEEYAAGLIDCFFRGVLDITEGTTLRAFLTSRLNCNPMRISKKLASHTIADVKIPKKLGSATYVRRDGVSDAERRSAEEHLRHLEHLSMSEQHLKEDIVIGVIGNKHTREEEAEPVNEGLYDHHHYGRYPHEQQHYTVSNSPHQEQYRRHHYGDSPSPVRASPASPFKMRRIVLDDYSHTPHEQAPVRHHNAHRSSPPGAYDHHDPTMRYQRVAY